MFGRSKIGVQAIWEWRLFFEKWWVHAKKIARAVAAIDQHAPEARQRAAGVTLKNNREKLRLVSHLST